MTRFDSTAATPPLDERFVADLESQLRRDIERRRRLGITEPAPGRSGQRGPRTPAIAALMLLSLFLGATATFAVVHQDTAPQRELHVRKAVIGLERAQARLEQHRANLAETIVRFEEGFVDSTEAATVRLRTDRAAFDVRLREIDLAETRRTGRAPVDELTAPLVGDEDFVTKRLLVRREAAALELEFLRTGERRLETLYAQGLVPDRALFTPRAERADAEQNLAVAQERLELRRAFIDDELTPVDVELRALQAEAEATHATAAARLDAASAALARTQALHDGGRVSSAELRAAQGAVRDAEADVALAEVERRLLRERIVTSPPRG